MARGYNPNRVPSGQGDASGQFTTGVNSAIKKAANVSGLDTKLQSRIVELSSVLQDKLTKRAIEQGYVLTSEGDNKSGLQIGGKDEIHLQTSNGDISIHSHPTNRPHSMMDVYSAAQDNLTASVVVTKDHIYVLEPGPQGWSIALEKVSMYDPHVLTPELAKQYGLVLTILTIP
jgi:hypothetical protein